MVSSHLGTHGPSKPYSRVRKARARQLSIVRLVSASCNSEHLFQLLPLMKHKNVYDFQFQLGGLADVFSLGTRL